jgi:peptidoglycan/LPS O-acetylase OafA/YrhL
LLLFIRNPWFALAPALALTAGTNYFLFIVGCACCYLRQASVNQEQIRRLTSLGAMPLAMLMLAGALLMAYPCPRAGVEVGGVYARFPSTGDLMRDYSYYTIAGGTLFFCAVIFNERTLNFLNNPIGRFLGDISFPIYLIHLPLIYFVRYTFGIHDLDFWEFLALDAVVFPIVIALSYAFSIWADKPAVQFADYLGSRMETVSTMAETFRARTARLARQDD